MKKSNRLGLLLGIAFLSTLAQTTLAGFGVPMATVAEPDISLMLGIGFAALACVKWYKRRK